MSTIDVTDNNYLDLIGELDGSLVRPSDPDWDAARQAWNLAVDQRPDAVMIAASVEDVQYTVRYAAEHGLRVLAQGTGHLAGAVGDLAGTILIRTHLLRGIRVDPAARILRTEAGVLWGEASGALAEHGLAALAGSSHDVGVVGYTLGGGYSWLGREYGLAASSLVAAELVLADGTLLRTDAANHPELLWALKGGGGNFAIVTAIEFRVHPVADVYAGMMLFAIERTKDVLQAYARWTRELDERATTCARILRFPPLPELPELIRGRSFVAVDGAVNAPDAEAEAILAPLRALGPQTDTFARIASAQLAALHMDPPAPVPAVGDGLIIGDFSNDVIDALLASAAGDADSPLLLVDLRHLGGALGRPDPNGGAVNRIEGRFLVFATGITPVPDSVRAVEAAVADVRRALGPWTLPIDYSNFREVETGPELYYPADALERLRAVKAAYDPRGVIRGAHQLG